MASEKKLSLKLKLLVDNSKHKVLFAEAGKDFVDFLFSILEIRVGSAMKMVTEHGFDGCTGRLFKSVDNLNDSYIRSGLDKSSLLDIVTPSLTFTQTLPILLQTQAKKTAPKKHYSCGTNHRITENNSIINYLIRVTDEKGLVCRYCNRTMEVEVEFVYPDAVKGEGSSGEGGYVKGEVTYMVTDDLVVTPMSSISSLVKVGALFKQFNVKEVGALEEKVVEVGMDEALALLEASFLSKTPLTDVFLGKCCWKKKVVTSLSLAKCHSNFASRISIGRALDQDPT